MQVRTSQYTTLKGLLDVTFMLAGKDSVYQRAVGQIFGIQGGKWSIRMLSTQLSQQELNITYKEGSKQQMMFWQY